MIHDGVAELCPERLGSPREVLAFLVPHQSFTGIGRDSFAISIEDNERRDAFDLVATSKLMKLDRDPMCHIWTIFTLFFLSRSANGKAYQDMCEKYSLKLPSSLSLLTKTNSRPFSAPYLS